jgi:hypothetical protein
MPLMPNRNAVQVGVLAGLANLLIFQHFMPTVADVKASDQFNPLVESSERTALLVSVGATAVVATFVRSWDTFLVGGIVIVAIDFAYKHANAVNPNTGTMQSPGDMAMDTGGSVHPLPDYQDVAQ